MCTRLAGPNGPLPARSVVPATNTVLSPLCKAYFGGAKDTICSVVQLNGVEHPIARVLDTLRSPQADRNTILHVHWFVASWTR